MDYEVVRRYCGLSRTSTWRLVRNGELEAVKLGRMVKVRKVSLDAYLDRHGYTEGGEQGDRLSRNEDDATRRY